MFFKIFAKVPMSKSGKKIFPNSLATRVLKTRVSEPRDASLLNSFANLTTY